MSLPSFVRSLVNVSLSLNSSWVAQPVAAYPGFLSIKPSGVSLLLPLWELQVHCKVTPLVFYQVSLKVCKHPITLRVERGTVRVKYFASEHNTMAWPGLNPESSAQTITSWCLPLSGHCLGHLFTACLQCTFTFPFFLTLLAIVVHDQAWINWLKPCSMID